MVRLLIGYDYPHTKQIEFAMTFAGQCLIKGNPYVVVYPWITKGVILAGQNDNQIG